MIVISVWFWLCIPWGYFVSISIATKSAKTQNRRFILRRKVNYYKIWDSRLSRFVRPLLGIDSVVAKWQWWQIRGKLMNTFGCSPKYLQPWEEGIPVTTSWLSLARCLWHHCQINSVNSNPSDPKRRFLVGFLVGFPILKYSSRNYS